MNNQIIENIAAKNGWNVFVKELPDRVSFDFQRKTLSGVSFCFTAEMKDGSMKYLVQEIVSFVDAIEPETCAVEWMIKSGAVIPYRYQQAVEDMDNIRTEAWLLACELSDIISGKPIWTTLSENGINQFHFFACVPSWAYQRFCKQSNLFRKT